MVGHTPGPWAVYRDGERRHIVAAGSVVDQPNSLVADWIADIEPDATGHDEAQCEADARLIAAAPRMLEWIVFMLQSDAAPREFANEGDAQYWFERRDDAHALLREIEGA